MYLTLLLVALLASVVAVALVLIWPKAKPPAPMTADLCEVCGAPATHELGAASDNAEVRGLCGGGGGSGMVATYCRADAPAGAVRVR